VHRWWMFVVLGDAPSMHRPLAFFSA